MPLVFYAPEADDDLVEIAEYIARDKPEAARGWIASIRATCETLARSLKRVSFERASASPDAARSLLETTSFFSGELRTESKSQESFTEVAI